VPRLGAGVDLKLFGACSPEAVSGCAQRWLKAFYVQKQELFVLTRELALLTRERVREELRLRKTKKRKEGPELRKAAALALLYWELAREVEWVEGGRIRR